MTKVSATPHVSVSISASVICSSVRGFQLHYTIFLCQISDGNISLFGETIDHIIAKLRHCDVSNISVSEKNDSVRFHPCTDTDTLKEVPGH